MKSIHIIVSLFLNFFPGFDYGQAPDLGSAFSFSMFTAAGAFGNSGATTITGNIGTNSGAFTGLGPTVDGQIHIADSVSAQVAIDVNSAYAYLSSMTYDTVIGNTLGSGQLLHAKIYSLGLQASTLNGNLILDGQGDSSSLFIFQIGGAFSTNSHAQVTLINSALPGNIFWQINGAVTIGDSSVFAGTMLATGAISLLDSSTLFGRGLSTAGAIALDNNSIFTGTPPVIPLPVELLSFSAEQAGVDVQLTWSTATETNNDYYTIERSVDGVEFVDLMKINGSGNCSTRRNYSERDDQPLQGISYYRLKQTDFDGKFFYSNLVELSFEKLQAFSIYPNPCYTYTAITFIFGHPVINAEIELFNCMGQEVISAIVNQQMTTLNTETLASGIYTYRVISNNKLIQSGRLVARQ